MDFFMHDSLRREVELRSGGRNTVIYDDFGNPNIMVCIPKANYEDYGFEHLTGTFAAFNVEGKEVNEIWVSKYPNTVANGGVPCSLPDTYRTIMKSPKEIKEKCLKKGLGWHQMTNLEYMAMTVPLMGVRSIDGMGFHNTPLGESHIETSSDADKRFDRIGSGPRTYYNFDYNGVYELYGGSREFADGIKFSSKYFNIVIHGTGDHTPMNRPFSDKYVNIGYEWDASGNPWLIDKFDGSSKPKTVGLRSVVLSEQEYSIEDGTWQITDAGFDLLRIQGLWTIPARKYDFSKTTVTLKYNGVVPDLQSGQAMPDFFSKLSESEKDLLICERGPWYNDDTGELEQLGVMSSRFIHHDHYDGEPYAGAARACYVTYTGKYKD